MSKSLKFFITLHKDYIMKYELLKRTAIALFVGGVISTYASADGQLDAAFGTIKTAIETNKAALESKADKALVDELDEDVGKLEDKVNGIAETAANKEDLGKLNDAVETLRDDVNNNTDILSQNSEDIAANKEAIEANKTAIETNKAAIDEIKNLQGYDSLTKVENIVSNKADQDYVEGLERDVKANTQDIKELSEGIRDNILPAIEANRTDIDANKADVDALKNRVDGAAAAANLLAQNIGLNKTNIEKKADKTDVDANKAAIGDLATVIDEAVTNLDGVVNDLHGDLSVTKHTVAENRKDIDKNASRITNTRNKQVLQNARLDNHSNRIGVNEAAIATNKADIETNKADIATNKANIITNRANIAANTAAIATHNQRLDHLDNRVNKLDKDLKRGLATQAALTGLFQPYTVGKANFTAAVGGYKSQTAVAIGTGYRYNKHVATKAGIAFTQGGAAYNVGVNFEW